VRFTLTYHGPLRGSGGGAAAHKHEVRRALHPQLRELWTHEPLRQKAASWLGSPPDPSEPEAAAALRQVAGRSFAVLVQAPLKLVAELDILLLRPEDPGAIVQRADIDNRLKTLFDALRCPSAAQEVPTGWAPTAAERPLHCLLDDDRLITRVNVDTDRLLAATSAEDVDVTIRVQLRALSPTWASVMLIS
jgi:hypothetical protein